LEVRDPHRQRRSLAIACAVAAVLQLALAPQFSLFGGAFNFMLVFALCMSMGNEIGSAVLIGFFSGLFYDMTSAAPVGLMSLLLTIGCFSLATVSRGVSGNVSTDTMRLIAVAILAINVVNGVVLFFMGVEGGFVSAVLVHGLACTVLDTIAALPFLVLVGASEPKKGFSARTKGTRFKNYKSLK